jgi:hypothetical protein
MKRSEAATLVAHCKELWGTSFKVTPETPDIWAQHAGDLRPRLSTATRHPHGTSTRLTAPPRMARRRRNAMPRMHRPDPSKRPRR